MKGCCRFCRGCIEPAVLSASGPYVCPACAREGTETFLGREPFAAQRLQPDFSIDSIIRKLFPPDVRWHLERMQCKVQLLQSESSCRGFPTCGEQTGGCILREMSETCTGVVKPGADSTAQAVTTAASDCSGGFIVAA